MSRRTGPTPAVRAIVLERAQNACEVCGQRGEQIHHRRPRGNGGSRRPDTNRPPNLLVLCGHCHDEIEGNRTWARTLGRLLPQSADPATEPVTLWGRRWLLTDDGDYRAVAA